MSFAALGVKSSSGASNAQSTNSSRNETGGDEPLTFDKHALYRLAIWSSSGFSHFVVKSSQTIGDNSQCRRSHECDGGHQEDHVDHSRLLTGSRLPLCSFDHILGEVE